MIPSTNRKRPERATISVEDVHGLHDTILFSVRCDIEVVPSEQGGKMNRALDALFGDSNETVLVTRQTHLSLSPSCTTNGKSTSHSYLLQQATTHDQSVSDQKEVHCWNYHLTHSGVYQTCIIHVFILRFCCMASCYGKIYIYLLHDEAIHQRREVCYIKSNAHFGVH